MKKMALRAFLCASTLLLLASCSSVPDDNAGGTSSSGNVPAEKKVSEKMTDDVWVELAAQEMYHSGQDQEGWNAPGGGRERLYAKYGVTEEQASAYAKAINGNVDRAMALTGKVDRRLKELQAGK